MNRFLRFSLLVLMFSPSLSIAGSELTCSVRIIKEVSVRQCPLLAEIAALEIGESDYAEHFAVFYALDNPAYSKEARHTIVFDYAEGAFAHKFEVMDIDGDGDDEILVWFMRGNHGHYLKIYEISSDAPKPTPWNVVFISDSWDCEIKDGYILCYTHDPDKGKKTLAKRYRIKKNSAEPVEFVQE